MLYGAIAVLRSYEADAKELTRTDLHCVGRLTHISTDNAGDRNCVLVCNPLTIGINGSGSAIQVQHQVRAYNLTGVCFQALRVHMFRQPDLQTDGVSTRPYLPVRRARILPALLASASKPVAPTA